MFNLGRNPKMIKVYALSKIDNPEINLTYVLDKNHIREYLKKYILLDRYDHYKIWCVWNNKDLLSKQSEDLYLDTHIDADDYNQFIIKKLKYRVEDMIGILRMFGNCLPLSCSFELPYEDEYFRAKLSEADKNGIDENIDMAETKDSENIEGQME